MIIPNFGSSTVKLPGGGSQPGMDIYSGDFVVDLAATPRRIDITQPGLPERPVLCGIYQWNGDQLEVWFGPDEDPKNRPKAFRSPKDGANYSVVTLERKEKLAIDKSMDSVANLKKADDGIPVTTTAKMRIRFLVNSDQVATLKEFLLFVSADRGKTWTQEGRAAPELGNTSFPFTAPKSGEYWFTLMTIDKSGVKAPYDVTTAPTHLKVRVDLSGKDLPRSPTAVPAKDTVELELRREIADLRKRIDELEKRLSQLYREEP